MPGCSSNRSTAWNPARSVQRDRRFVAGRDHDVGAVLSPPADLHQETLHQKCSCPGPPRDGIDGDGQQFCPVACVSGAVAKRLQGPAP